MENILSICHVNNYSMPPRGGSGSGSGGGSGGGSGHGGGSSGGGSGSGGGRGGSGSGSGGYSGGRGGYSDGRGGRNDYYRYNNRYRRGYYNGGDYDYYYYDNNYPYFVIPQEEVKRQLTIPLTFAQEVFPYPRPVDPMLTGSFTLTFNKDLTQATYKLLVSPTQGVPGTKVSKAHIHTGRVGQMGPILETLFNTENPVDGLVKDGFITTDVTDLYNRIRDGSVYVNVHGTNASKPAGSHGNDYTEGMLRGQLVF